jgi:SAM-dependent methyltransferase
MGFAWEHVPTGSAHLDFGCYHGQFLASLAGRTPQRRVGADVSREAIEVAQSRAPGVEFVHLRACLPLPFGDQEFDSITLLEVLEHVDDQRGLLRELRRTLRPGGVLIVTVPRRHLLSFLDLGNLKFRSPRLHRWFYIATHGQAAYRRRYVENPDGLIGDISAAKAWHEHFSPPYLRKMLEESGFLVVAMDGSGFFMRAITIARRTCGWIKAFDRLLLRVSEWDARRFAAANLFCLARRPPE